MSEKLPVVVKRLGWVSFFADVCSEMVYPILPLFLIGALKAPAAALGLIEGSAESLVSLMKAISGIRSDQRKARAPYIQAGYFLSALGKPLIGLAAVWPTVLAGRLLDRYGKGIRTTARDAMIADSVEPENYGYAFGFHRAMDSAGAVTGVLICALLLWLFKIEYRNIFLLAVIPGMVAFAITMSLKDKVSTSVAKEEPVEPENTEKVPFSKGYYEAIILTSVFALANSSDTFLLLHAGKLGLAPVVVVLAYAIYNVTYTLTSKPAGELSDKIGRYKVMGSGWLLYAFVYLGFAFTNALYLWPLLLLYGIYTGLTDGTSKALVASLTPKGRKGTGLGMYYGAAGFCTLGTNVLTGWLYEAHGPKYAFGFGSAMAFVAVALLLALRLVNPNPSQVN